MRITIVGGHGRVALILAPILTAAGHRVTAVVRNPDHVAAVAATGAEARVESVEQASGDDLTALLSGQDAVIWSAGAGGGNPARTYAVDRDAAIRCIDAAVRAGAKRYVTVSFSRSAPEYMVPEDDPFRPYMEAKIAADEHLRASALNWTILAPGPLTLEPSNGTVNPKAAPDRGDRCSRELVAQVAVAVLEDEHSFGRTLILGDGDVAIDQWLATFSG